MDFEAAAVAKQGAYMAGCAAAIESAAWGLKTPHERNVAMYVNDEITIEEYERREKIRLAREAAHPLSGKAA